MELGVVIFDLTATAKSHEFFAKKAEEQNEKELAKCHLQVAAKYREAIRRIKER